MEAGIPLRYRRIVPPEPAFSASEKVQTALLKGLSKLPAPVKRLIAGKPVVRDGQTLDLDVQLFLKVEKLQPGPALGDQPVPDGRRVMLEQARVVGGSQPIGSVQDLEVDGAEGILPARLYVPRAGSDALLVFFHGGGFIYGDLDSHDALCRFLAEQAGVRVLSVEYRLAPEARFPAAYDDCAAAYRWVVKNVDSLGAAPDRLAVGGDSAGGALAATTALVAAREGLPLAFQLLIYPMTDQTNSTDSHAMFSQGYYLTKSFKELGRDCYVPRREDWTDPRMSVLYDDVPQGLAPAYLCTAGFDPLRDEGEAYARKLADAGVPVELKRFPELIHGFINMVGLDVPARAAIDEVVEKLAAALR
jgi:acetyl esterase